MIKAQKEAKGGATIEEVREQDTMPSRECSECSKVEPHEVYRGKTG